MVVRVVSVLTLTISPSKAGFGRVMVHVVGAVPDHIRVPCCCVARVVAAPEPEITLRAAPFLTRLMQRN
jgi:hypothetical protein